MDTQTTTTEAVVQPRTSPATVPGFGITDVIMLITMVTWGLNFIAIKVGVTELPPLAFTSIRHVGASILLLMMLASQRMMPRFSRREWLWLVGLGLIGITIHQPLAMYGVANTTAGNAGLILSSTPVFVALFNHWLGRERLSAKAWFGVIVAFVGMAMVIGGDEGFSLSSQHLVGDVLALVAIILWAVYTMLAQPLLLRRDSLAVSALSLTAGTIPLTLLALPAIRVQNWQAVSSGALLGMLYSTVVVIALGYLVWNWGVKKLGSTRASLYSNLSPVVTLIASVIILNENLTILRLVGAVIIIGGIYLSRSSTIVSAEIDT
ncbi:MAG: DMT family transporter [Anaerolineae bacterium]|nr:DMT family transporter [Anaerolineae bacterium]